MFFTQKSYFTGVFCNAEPVFGFFDLQNIYLVPQSMNLAGKQD
jgi:hypothetical protein